MSRSQPCRNTGHEARTGRSVWVALPASNFSVVTGRTVRAPHDGKEHPIADRKLIEGDHGVSIYTEAGDSSSSDLIVGNGEISKDQLSETPHGRRDEV